MSTRDGFGTLQLYAHQVRTWHARSVNRRIFSAMVSVGGVVLVNEWFPWPAATPTISSALMLALLFTKGPQWGVYTLVIGLVGGRVVEGLVLV